MLMGKTLYCLQASPKWTHPCLNIATSIKQGESENNHTYNAVDDYYAIKKREKLEKYVFFLPY